MHRRQIALLICILILLVGSKTGHCQKEALIARLEGPINPATASFVKKAVALASERASEVMILEIDTPGGLASSMKSMVKEIMNSSVPVVSYVGPRGAGAASAGVLITIAAHVAAMAPGTNIGAAHPVNVGGKDMDKTMSEKVVNDMVSYAKEIAKERNRNQEWVERAVRQSESIGAEMALVEGVVDLIADDLDSLLNALDGRKVVVKGLERRLNTKACSSYYYSPSWADRVLFTISDPNIAYILMMIGMAGIYFELSHPGAIFPGVIGGISLILAFYSFQTLPVNYAGLLLIILAVILFIAEIKVQSFGVLTIGGLISLILGSIMLFEGLRVSVGVLIPTVVGVSLFFLVVAFLAIRAISRRPVTGEEGIVGETGVVLEPLEPEGIVFVHGEYWKAQSPVPLGKGEKVEVTAIEGLSLKVKRKE